MPGRVRVLQRSGKNKKENSRRLGESLCGETSASNPLGPEKIKTKGSKLKTCNVKRSSDQRPNRHTQLTKASAGTKKVRRCQAEKKQKRRTCRTPLPKIANWRLNAGLLRKKSYLTIGKTRNRNLTCTALGTLEILK